MFTAHLRAVVLVAGLVMICSSAARAQSRVVVTDPGDSGAGTLRAAIAAANSSAESTTIDFDIDTRVFGPGPWTIALRSELPEFTAPVLVRGFSQPGARASSSPLSSIYRIELNDSAIAFHPSNHGAMLAFAPGSERSSVNGLAFVGGSASRLGAAILVLATRVAVRANRIGVRHDGTLSRYHGIAIASVCADGTIIGGDSPGEGNLIGGTGNSAIMISGAQHLIGFNWIGYDRFGTSDSLANIIIGSGILTGSVPYLVPHRLALACSPEIQAAFWGLRNSTVRDNWISATTEAAIELNGTFVDGAPAPHQGHTSGNAVTDNILGQDLFLTQFARVEVGIRLTKGASRNTLRDNTVGRAAAGILFGVGMDASSSAGAGNRLSGNRFMTLNFPAIGLDPATGFLPPANDALDADTGANGLQNKPVLFAVSAAGGIEGELRSKPNRTYRIELFRSVKCQAVSCTDAAEFFLGGLSVITDSAGVARVATTTAGLSGGSLPLGGLRAGDAITATATDSDSGDSSELSNVVLVQPAVTPQVSIGGLPSPIAAMTGPGALAVTVAASSQSTPVGQVELFIASASGVRSLGTASLAGGSATIPAPANATFFQQAGRYELFARYSGDGFHSAASSPARTVVVFRPSMALLSPERSALIRRDLASGDRERFDVVPRTFVPLVAGNGSSLLDSERLGAFPLDLALTFSGKFETLDGAGGILPAVSPRIVPGIKVLDLLQADADPRADALTHDPTSDRYELVSAAFAPAGETAVQLPVDADWTFATSGDFNGDGTTDLVFRDRGSAEAVVLELQNATIHRTSRIAPQAAEHPVAAADLNGDGYEELVWLDAATGEVHATVMKIGVADGNARAQLPPGTWSTPGSGHFALPRDPDFGLGHLVFANSGTGEVVIWRNPQIAGNVLSVQPTPLFFDPAYEVERMR